jgi:hypothetical protein
MGFGLLFVALEIPAIYKRVPWTPLSDAVWGAERAFKPLPYLVVAALIVLILHLVVAKFR